jgi:hypothetical protein
MESNVTSADEHVPFDETAVTRGRHKCFFCDVHKSDEWKFIARLNAFICKSCQDRIEGSSSGERKIG